MFRKFVESVGKFFLQFFLKFFVLRTYQNFKNKIYLNLRNVEKILSKIGANLTEIARFWRKNRNMQNFRNSAYTSA